MCVRVIYIGPFAIGMLVGEGIRRRVSSTRLPRNNDPRRWVYEHVSVVVCMCVCVCVCACEAVDLYVYMSVGICVPIDTNI